MLQSKNGFIPFCTLLEMKGRALKMIKITKKQVMYISVCILIVVSSALIYRISNEFKTKVTKVEVAASNSNEKSEETQAIGPKTQLLKVSENKRFLIKEDGSPFYWQGDTAWELFHRLTREEADKYLADRAAKGFNVVQAVALAELDGLETPNAHGDRPLLKAADGGWDVTKPDTTEGSEFSDAGQYDYWDHVDYIVNKAETLGVYIALLPTWGDKWNMAWGVGPISFTPENARAYGEWIGNRYKDKTNIIWVMGGDRMPEGSNMLSIVNRMAEGIRIGDKGRHLMTYHPGGQQSSSKDFQASEWLDFNMIQSGHNTYDFDNYRLVQNDYEQEPMKPTLDGEPRYEDHPVNFNPENGWFQEYDVRQAAYWAVFAGAFGHTYGNHNIWQMKTPERQPLSYAHGTWVDALSHPGAGQMQYLHKLMESRPFLSRVPDQSIVEDELYDADHIQATRGDDYAFVYSATGQEFTVNMGKISGDKVKAYWYDPRTGESNVNGEYVNKGIQLFLPPTNGRGNDWVLVLDDITKGFGLPGVMLQTSRK